MSFQRALNNAIIKKAGGAERSKRQTDEQEMCIENVLDETVGKYSACKLAALDELDVEDPTNEQWQTFINTVFAVICERDCGRAVIEAYEACGIIEDDPGLEDFIIGICASDASGKECYRSAADFFNLYDIEEACYTILNGTCTCKAALEEAVSDIRCCLNVYHHYYVAVDITVYDTPSELYTDACNVTLPKDCSTSPLDPDDSTATSTSGTSTSPRDPDDSAATSVIFSALIMMAALVFISILQ